MSKETQSRLRSRLTWIVIVGVVVGVVKHYIPGITDDVQLISDAVITILTIVGVLNDPTNQKGF